jgi:hypothetical protein
MNSLPLKPANLPEKLIWYYIISTYAIYLLGAQYVLAPLLATVLAICFVHEWWDRSPTTSLKDRIQISPLIWSWIVGMIIIEIALIVGHVNFNLELVQIVKSSLYWYKHWALFALFLLAGHLQIRPQIIYRAVCILCAQCLILILLNAIALGLNLPNLIYTSPLQAFGGDVMFYDVNLFAVEPNYGEGLRLELFAPWPPALGLVANMFFWLANEESDPKWRYSGMASAVAMAILSVSRTAVLCLPVVWFLTWMVLNFMRPKVQLGTSFTCLLLGISSPLIIDWIEIIRQKFAAFRPGSSKVRGALIRMTLERWRTEGPIWGRGINTSRGPASLGFMPIGTHHTWFGVLFLHGVVGFLAFAIPFFWTLFSLCIKARTSQIARVGLKIMLVLLVFSFCDIIETIAYLYWPGLLFVGIALSHTRTIDPEPANSLAQNKILVAR